MAAKPSPRPRAWLEHDLKVRPYVWTRRALAAAELLLALGFVAVLLSFSLGQALELRVETLVSRPFPRWLAYFGVLGVCWQVLSFPCGAFSHLVERRYALSRQSFPGWLWDQAKGLLLGAALGVLGLGVVFLSLESFGRLWWLACAGLLTLCSVVLAELAPVLLIPIFFTLRPMAPGPLKERLLALCARFGVAVKEVYHWGLGEKTEKGNAAFAGLGASKRILIGDTLYQKYPAEEVEAVFAHELGHQVHLDLWRGLGLSTLMLFASFYLASAAAAPLLARFGASLERPFGLFLFFIALAIIEAPAGPVLRAFSRRRERLADRFAIELGLGAPLARALERLTVQNFGLFEPHPAWEFLFYSHPAPWRRVAWLKEVAPSRP